jgi:hypothetical protein
MNNHFNKKKESGKEALTKEKKKRKKKKLLHLPHPYGLKVDMFPYSHMI